MPEHAIVDQRKIQTRNDHVRNDHGALLWVSMLLHSLLLLLPWIEKSPLSAPPQEPISPIAVVSQLPGSRVEPAPAVPSVSLAQPALAQPSSALTVPKAANSPPTATPEPLVEPTSVEPDFAQPFEQKSDRTVDESILNEPLYESLDLNSSNRPDDGVDQAGDSQGNEVDNLEDQSLETRTPDESQEDESQKINQQAVINESVNNESVDEVAIAAAAWESFLGHAQSQSDGFEELLLLDIFSFFGEPGQVDLFFDENSTPKVNVSNHYLYPEQTPEEVLQAVIMPQLTNQQGLVMQPQENFSPGLMYTISQGENRHYLTILKLNERSGSVLILSDAAPSLPDTQ